MRDELLGSRSVSRSFLAWRFRPSKRRGLRPDRQTSSACDQRQEHGIDSCLHVGRGSPTQKLPWTARCDPRFEFARELLELAHGFRRIVVPSQNLISTNSLVVLNAWRSCVHGEADTDAAIGLQATRSEVLLPALFFWCSPYKTVTSPGKEVGALELNRDEVIDLLNRIVELELAGAVRYTQYSLMVWTCPHPDYGLDARAGGGILNSCHTSRR